MLVLLLVYIQFLVVAVSMCVLLWTVGFRDVFLMDNNWSLILLVA